MSINLDGKVAVITGAARGIGAELARDFVQRGAKVLLTDIAEEAGKATAAALGDNAAFAQQDVSDEAGWPGVFDQCEAHFGKADILINNAGIEVTSFITECKLDEFRKLLDVNVGGVFLGIKHGMQRMSAANGGKGGAILNLSSMSHVIAGACFGPYGATKSAVDKLTKVAAVEAGLLDAKIRVNCLYPGIIDTGMQDKLGQDLLNLGLFPDAQALQEYIIGRTPLKRTGTPEDVAKAAAYLCSDEAEFITGVGMSVDGGMALG
ncbi:SDR family NAD(P)-dependent oxidoreductase [Marinobacterium sp. YM272]|uniref:SDR family NAD(P)-dependent oxidoreductase n=1 Tax=Marinobacterium sp. YM272 TaxID=3421654 RepID=UPI003D7F66A8